MDVEGHEDQVINGAKNTIKKYKPLLYIERPSKNIIKFLKKIEYEIYIFDIEKPLIKVVNMSKKFRNYYFINKKRKLFS